MVLGLVVKLVRSQKYCGAGAVAGAGAGTCAGAAGGGCTVILG